MGIALPERPLTQKATREALLSIAKRGGPLIRGTSLRCPGCEKVADILDYMALEYSERYGDQVIVPLKCRSCRHVFALKP